MKTLTRNILLALTFGGLLAGTGAAFAHDWHGGKDGCSRANFQERMQHFEKRRAERLEHLKAALKLTPAQQSAWEAFAKASTEHPPFPAHWAKGKPTEQATPAPERLDRHIKFAEERLNHMKTVDAAVHKLYDTLSPQQRKTMNDFFNHHRHHGWHHHH